LINEGSKIDSKSAAASGEKNRAHSQFLSCANVEKRQVKNKKISQQNFLILQVMKNEIYYEKYACLSGSNVDYRPGLPASPKSYRDLLLHSFFMGKIPGRTETANFILL
jgi:hypothetical protein